MIHEVQLNMIRLHRGRPPLHFWLSNQNSYDNYIADRHDFGVRFSADGFLYIHAPSCIDYIIGAKFTVPQSKQGQILQEQEYHCQCKQLWHQLSALYHNWLYQTYQAIREKGKEIAVHSAQGRKTPNIVQSVHLALPTFVLNIQNLVW